jgi:DNA-binding transcriptional ArsR family regulator
MRRPLISDLYGRPSGAERQGGSIQDHERYPDFRGLCSGQKGGFMDVLSVRCAGFLTNLVDKMNENRNLDADMENQDPPFTFRAAQTFVTAVEAQSVTKAAHRLGISPSSVSQQLVTLEAALGTKLIERSAQNFRLTRAGAFFS